MPALTSLVLTDRTPTTPVDHTFTPSNVVSNVGTVAESSGTKIGDSKFSLSSRKTTGGRYKATLKLEVPVVEVATINGIDVPTVVRTSFANVDFSYDGASSTQERANLVGMLASSLAASKTMVNSTIVNLEGVWG